MKNIWNSIEAELVEELNSRGLEFRYGELESAVEYIVTLRSMHPEYSVKHYVEDTLSNYPEMLIEK